MNAAEKNHPHDFHLPTLEELEAMDDDTINWLNNQLALIQGTREPKNLELETHAAIQAWIDGALCAGHDPSLGPFDRTGITLRLLYTHSFDDILLGLKLAGYQGRKPMDVLRTRVHIAAWANAARQRNIP